MYAQLPSELNGIHIGRLHNGTENDFKYYFNSKWTVFFN